MAGAYYNEVDPNAAQWLRNLIAAGHIAPGEVDERSIIDVQADDLKGFTQCHFFAGIGVWSYALRRAGWPDDRPVWTGSCPCQPFSSAGRGLGHEDERHLWPAWEGLISIARPHVVFGEQVANGDGYAWLDLVGTELESLDYAVGAVCPAACGVGAPHIRQRLYFVADAEHAGSNRSQGASTITGSNQSGIWLPDGDSSLFKLADASSELRQQVGGSAHGHEGPDGRRSDGDHFLSGSSQDSILAHADGERFGATVPRRSESEDSEQCSVGDGVALGDTQHAGLEGHSRDGDHGHKSGRVGAQPAGSASEAGFSSVVVDTAGRGFGVGRDASQQAGGGYLDGSESGGSLGNTERIGGREVLPEWGPKGRAPAGRPDAGGAVNGFWAGADWVWCRDPSGPRWRPVEPGTFPLVAGATSRVVKLRAYGNAIVAPVAEEFIRAYIAERGL